MKFIDDILYRVEKRDTRILDFVLIVLFIFIMIIMILVCVGSALGVVIFFVAWICGCAKLSSVLICVLALAVSLSVLVAGWLCIN